MFDAGQQQSGLFCPAHAPTRGGDILAGKYCAGARCITRLTLKLQTTGTTRVRFRRLGDITQCLCGRIVWIHRRRSRGSQVDEKPGRRYKRARNEATPHESTPRDSSIHDGDPPGKLKIRCPKKSDNSLGSCLRKNDNRPYPGLCVVGQASCKNLSIFPRSSTTRSRTHRLM
jgi:hypothetical protein